jgi:uncharacterized DUF497 family protein
MVDPLGLLAEAVGFVWDRGNFEKNWIRHRVSQSECEELFLNEPLLVAADVKHSAAEARYFALGQTDEARRLFVVFTIRELFIRVISARDMNRRERKEYDHAQAEEGNAQDSEV